MQFVVPQIGHQALLPACVFDPLGLQSIRYERQKTRRRVQHVHSVYFDAIGRLV